MSLKALFRAGATALIALALSTTIALAQDHDHGHDRDEDRHDRDYDHDRDDHGHGHDHEHGRQHERYADHDRDIHDWYRAHYDHLPPGWAKRDRLPPGLERRLIVNGTLAPELRERMQPCPRELEVMLPPAPPNYVHVVIGGNLVLYNRATLQIGDVFHLSIN
jgi:Ni/Co efflux regulator RcnB